MPSRTMINTSLHSLPTELLSDIVDHGETATEQTGMAYALTSLLPQSLERRNQALVSYKAQNRRLENIETLLSGGVSAGINRELSIPALDAAQRGLPLRVLAEGGVKLFDQQGQRVEEYYTEYFQFSKLLSAVTPNMPGQLLPSSRREDAKAVIQGLINAYRDLRSNPSGLAMHNASLMAFKELQEAIDALDDPHARRDLALSLCASIRGLERWSVAGTMSHALTWQAQSRPEDQGPKFRATERGQLVCAIAMQRHRVPDELLFHGPILNQLRQAVLDLRAHPAAFIEAACGLLCRPYDLPPEVMHWPVLDSLQDPLTEACLVALERPVDPHAKAVLAENLLYHELQHDAQQWAGMARAVLAMVAPERIATSLQIVAARNVNGLVAFDDLEPYVRRLAGCLDTVQSRGEELPDIGARSTIARHLLDLARDRPSVAKACCHLDTLLKGASQADFTTVVTSFETSRLQWIHSKVIGNRDMDSDLRQRVLKALRSTPRWNAG